MPTTERKKTNDEPLPVLTIRKLRELLSDAPAELLEREVWVGHRDGMGFVSQPVVYIYLPGEFFAGENLVLSSVPYPSAPPKLCPKCKRTER
jgi:hypothetical protein